MVRTEINPCTGKSFKINQDVRYNYLIPPWLGFVIALSFRHSNVRTWQVVGSSIRVSDSR